MTERTMTVEFQMKLNPYRDTTGRIDSVIAKEYFDGMELEPGDRVIAFKIEVPISMWDTPLITAKIKPLMQEWIDTITEEISVDAN